MTTAPALYRPRGNEMMLALAIGVALVAAAFAAAWLTRDSALFSLAPPDGSAPDMRPDQRLDLHRTFFTVWAAIVLVTPALCLFPFRRQSPAAGRYWLAFWSAALLVFLVHFFWAVWVLYGNDWQRIRHTSRVSAPILDTVFTVWWVFDVALAWSWPREGLWIRLQRWGVHLLALLLFFMGAAREGELPASRMLGYAMAAAVVLAAVRRWRGRSAGRGPIGP